MKTWELALEEFLRPWKLRPEVVGAILCGSRVHGTDDKFSDVDVHIVLRDSMKWRERGNKKIRGVMIEYFANPARLYAKYAANERGGNGGGITRMLGHGRILFDKTGAVAKIIRWARRAMGRSFPRPGRLERESGKYRMEDSLDALNSLRHH